MTALPSSRPELDVPGGEEEDDLPFHPVEIRQEEQGFTLERWGWCWVASAPGLPSCGSMTEREALLMLAGEAEGAGQDVLAARLRKAVEGGT